jgi:hypothetical protein
LSRSHRLHIFGEVAAERTRQEKLVEENRHLGWCSCADPGTATEYRLAVLAEEFGEVAIALNEIRVGNEADLRAELVHVAAVAIAWVEGLDAA